MDPRQPEHADYTRAVPSVRSERIRVRRHLVEYAYARGNPTYATPQYEWLLLVDGVTMGTFRRRRDAVAAAHSQYSVVG